MRLEELNESQWKEIISQLDEKTGTFAGRQVLCIKDQEINFFNSYAEALHAGYKEFDPALFLKKSMQVVTAKDTDLGMKIGAYVSRKLNRIDEKEISFYKDIAFNQHLLSVKQLKDYAIQLIEIYEEVHEEEMLKIAQFIFDAAANHALKENDSAEYFRIREMQVQSVHMPNFETLIETNEMWNKLPGIYYDHLDSGSVKQSTVRFYKVKKENKEIGRMDFKVNHPERDSINQRIDLLDNALEKGWIIPPKVFENGIGFTTEPYAYPTSSGQKGPELGLVRVVEFKGVGRVLIGKSTIIGSLYNRITVEVDSTQDPKKIMESAHQMLTYLGLGQTLFPSSQDDEDRKKLMLVFRTFFPRQAFDLEGDETTFTLSPKDLEKKIVDLFPETEEIFKKYLHENPDLITKVEVFPGKNTYAIDDLSTILREEEAVFLFSGSSAKGTPDDVADKIIRILEKGLLSTQDRWDRELFIRGASSKEDHGANSADYTFTRGITRKDILNETLITEFPLSGDIQFLINLDVLNRGCYMYTTDCYGEKNRKRSQSISLFKNRLNPKEFFQKLRSEKYHENEILVKNRIPPKFFMGIILPNEEIKKTVFNKLKEKNLLDFKNGIYFYKGKPFDDFFIVTNKFDKNRFNLKE